MASPFTVFRKYQAAMIVVFMAMLMVAFVILPPIMDMMGAGQGADPVVVTSRHGDWHESDIGMMRQRRQVANGFMHSAMEAALGMPLQRNYVPFGEATEESVVETALLAMKAQELGMVVTDGQINEFLTRVTQNAVSGVELSNLAQRYARSQTYVMDALRTELLASNFRNLYLAGTQTTPPALRWDYFKRVYRTATIEAVPVAVTDYLDQVANPTEAELVSFFDEHKSDYPVPGSPDPGFRQPAKGRFQYFRADYDAFVAKIDVTDEEIATYYEEHKDDYPYTGMTFEPVQPPLDDPDPTPDDGGTPDPLDATNGEPDATDEAAPVDDAETVPEGAEDPANDDQSDDETAPPLSSAGQLPIHRVSYQQPGDEDGLPLDDDAAPLDAELDDPPVDLATDGDATDDAVAPPGDPLDATNPTDPLDAIDTAATLDPLDDDPGKYILPTDIRDGPLPKHDPLWKVRDRVRETLAAQRAGDAMRKALDLVAEQMTSHATRMTRWEVARDRNQSDPGPRPEFDSSAITLEDGLSVHTTPLLSAREIHDQIDLGQSFVGNQAFVQVAYREFDPYRVERSFDIGGNQYVFWKLEGAVDFVPELDQVRDEVIRAWKTIQAREPAMAAANKLRVDAAASRKPLAEVFAGQSDIEVLTPPQFSWMHGGTTAFINPDAPLRMSEVEGVVDAGPEFMRSVFDLQIGEVGVAMNHPQTIAYVIRMVDINSESLAREMFMVDNFARYQSLASDDLVQLGGRWMDEIKSDARLSWQRDADADLVR